MVARERTWSGPVAVRSGYTGWRDRGALLRKDLDPEAARHTYANR